MVSSMAVAAACSPARRDAPMPRSLKPRGSMAHSTSKLCWCAAPSVPTTRYTASGRLRACSHSCNSVLGSLPTACMAGWISTSENKRCTTVCAAAKPASRYTAPSTDSRASAKIDGRLGPPERISPSPRRSSSDKPRSSASLCRVSWRTRLARMRDKSPSAKLPRRAYSMSETARPNTESPRNSRRS